MLTTLALTMSPTARYLPVSLPTSLWLVSSMSTRSSMTWLMCRRPSSGPNLTNAPNLRISTTLPMMISLSLGLNTTWSNFTVW